MSERIVECVPNFSEGRRHEVVAALVDAVESVAGVALLDRTWDVDHNRCVLTFAGTPDAVKEAAFAACARAAELIDMQQHEGVHPRIGATDVIPFIPIRGVTMEDCAALARSLAADIAARLGIPTYLYAEAALRPERKSLPWIRRGNYELLKQEIATEARRPDFGPATLHPTAGATAVGARPALIAFNVELGTPDLAIAQAIARRVRQSSGGLMHVQAMGVALESRGITQVSMNLLDYRHTPIYRALELVRVEARRYGVSVIGSEIIGLVPTDALVETAQYYLGVHRFSQKQILESRLAEALAGRQG